MSALHQSPISQLREDAQIDRIALISSARSGTTHLIRLMHCLENLHVVSDEWLEATGVTWAQEAELNEFRRRHNVNYSGHKDPRLNAWVRANKEETLQTLEALAQPNDRAVLYKSFYSQLAAPDFDRLFYNRPETKFVFLMRRPVDAYISLVKAKTIKKWVEADTTSLKPDLDPDHFLVWWKRTSDWFIGLRDRLDADKRPYGHLTYEDDVMGGVHHLVKRAVQELGVAGFETKLNRSHLAKAQVQRVVQKLKGDVFFGSMGAAKQDKERDTKAKVANWDAFTRQVAERQGSLDCLDHFMRQPESVFWGAETLPEEPVFHPKADASS